MQKRDFILIAALLLVCAGAAALLTPRERSAPLHAVVTQDGKQLYDIPLTGHRGTEEIVVADEHGTNTIRIEDETIAVVRTAPTSSVSRPAKLKKRATSSPASRTNSSSK